MIVRVLKATEAKAHGQIVQVPDLGLCQVVDAEATLKTASQLTAWLSGARTAAQGSTLLVAPKLNHVNQSPDSHVYVALDVNGKPAAQITAT